MANLPVKGLPEHEWGKSRVRINRKFRGDLKRYSLLKITNKVNNQSCLAIVLGHNDENAIYMDFDTRNDLGIGKKRLIGI